MKSLARFVCCLVSTIRHGVWQVYPPRRLACLLMLGVQAVAFDARAEIPILNVARMESTPVPLSGYLGVLEDSGLALTLDDVRREDGSRRFHTRAPSPEGLNLGYTQSAWWFRVKLRNDSDHPTERTLELAYNRISEIEFYQPAVAGDGYDRRVTGNVHPFATRLYRNRNFVFPVTLPPRSEQVYYLRLQSTSPMLVPLRLWTREAFHDFERSDYLAQALYFGLAAGMVLFNLLLLLAMRDVIYLLYVCFVSSMAVSLAARSGLLKEYFPFDAPLWSATSSFVGNSLSFFFFLLFMRHMLNTWQVLPRFDRVLKALAGLHLLVPVGFVLAYQSVARPTLYFYISSLCVIMGTAIYCAWQRQRSAYLFITAFTLLFCTAIMNSLTSLGWLPTNVITSNLLQLGSAMEMLLLAFALADRFNIIRQEKIKAQKDLLHTQELLIDNLQNSERVLEMRVAERTEELQVLNRKLEALSVTDALTGIANRRRFDAVLASEWSRAQRNGQPLALGLIDVDWFKKYNDAYGHQAGDECLRQVGQVLAGSVCRTGDLTARYGGEEFAFIAPASNTADALGMATNICERIRALALPHEKSAFGIVTLSVGVAVFTPRQGDTPEMLVTAADQALYQAKECGRDQVRLAAPPGTTSIALVPQPLIPFAAMTRVQPT